MAKANSYSKIRKKKNKRFLFTIIALIIISSIAYYISSKAMDNEINSLNKEITSTQKKLDKANAEIKNIENDYKIRNTDQFKEKMAKERLGMVKNHNNSKEDDLKAEENKKSNEDEKSDDW